jgi:hypothetical protein
MATGLSLILEQGLECGKVGLRMKTPKRCTMKNSIALIMIISTGLLSSLCGKSLAEEKSLESYMEILDIVYEWSPKGKAIQVGEHLISSFNTVWSDTGSGEIILAGSQAIKVGGVVKAYLIKKDENGFWLADRIVVLSGRTLDSAVQSFPENKKLDFQNSQKNTERNVPPKVPSTPAQKPVLENGVWKN